MLVGDFPTFDDLGAGLPFRGRSGQLLWYMFRKEWGISQAVTYTTYLYKDMVEDLTEEDREAALNTLQYEILVEQPRLIVPLGINSMRALVGVDINMEAAHGILFNLRPDWEMPGVRVFPCINPATGLSSPDFLAFAAADLRAGARHAVAAYHGELPPGQALRAVYPRAEWGMAGVPVRRRKVVFLDTEGYPGRPWCLSYYDGGKESRVVLATDSVGLQTVKEIVDLADNVVLHNAMFDLGMLRSMGVPIPDAKLQDSMVLAYNRKVEPQGLKNGAARYMGIVMDEYEDIAGPVSEMKAQEYLAAAAEKEWPEPDPVLETKGGELSVRQPQGIVRRIMGRFDARDKGKPVQFRKWWTKDIEHSTRVMVEEKMGPMPDFTFDDVPPQIAKQYAGLDAVVTCGVWHALVQMGNIPDSYRVDMDAIPMFERMQANGMAVNVNHFKNLEVELSGLMDKVVTRISTQYNDGDPFNPNSPLQVANLLFHKMGLRSSKLTKTGKLSTNDKVLEALRNDHPVVADVIEYRELATMRDRFATMIPEVVHSDGRVRGNIKTTRVETGRPAMSDPNLLAMPVRSEWGTKIRKGFVAPEGRKLGSCDLNQIELRVMAHLSGDPNMIRLFVEGKDIHSWVASRMFGIPEDKLDPKLHRYPAKRVGFGVGTGIQAAGLLDQMKLAGVHTYSLDDCQNFIDGWLREFSVFHEFMKYCRAEARRQGYVEDMWGRVRYLPGSNVPFASLKAEADRQSHSHKIQGAAAGLMKKAMKNIWDVMPSLWEQGIYFEPLLQIYDDFICEFDPAYEELVGSVVEWAMTSSVELMVPVTAKFASGYNWGEMDK